MISEPEHQENNEKKATKEDIISNLPTKEVYGQLLSILSNRRRDKDGRLIIGITEYELQRVLNHTTLEETEDLMEEFNEFLLSLGLSIMKYHFISHQWYAIKSLYAAPIELKEDELAILGAFIMLMEKNEDKKTNLTVLIDYLTTREYFNEYKIKRLVNYLVDNGYIFKGKLGKYSYGPKLLIEINEEARSLIAEQTTELLF